MVAGRHSLLVAPGAGFVVAQPPLFPMIRSLFVVALLSAGAVSQNPVQTLFATSPITGLTVQQDVYRPAVTPHIRAFVTNTLMVLGLADLGFGAYSCGTPQQSPNFGVGDFAIVAIGGHDQLGVDVFVTDPVFLIYPPGVWQYGGFGRRQACALPAQGELVYGAGLLIGYLPAGADFTSQAFALTPNGVLLSEAVRVRVY